MKNNLIYILFIFLAIGLSSCSNYEAQFEGAYDEENGTSANAKIMVFAVSGDVYIGNGTLQDVEKIDDSGEVKIVSINNAHTKVIFKRENENIQIYDIETESVVDQVPNSQDATWFDFHANNETIFFQTDWLVSAYGPEIIPNNSIDIKEIFSSFDNGNNLRGVTILENGDIIYSVQISNTSLSLHYYNGIEEVSSQSYTGSYRQHLRLTEDETVVWTSNLTQTNISIHDISDLALSGGFNDVSFAAPSESNQGFLVFQNFNNSGNDAILLPGTTLGRIITGGQNITSIDY